MNKKSSKAEKNIDQGGGGRTSVEQMDSDGNSTSTTIASQSTVVEAPSDVQTQTKTTNVKKNAKSTKQTKPTQGEPSSQAKSSVNAATETPVTSTTTDASSSSKVVFCLHFKRLIFY
jgi:hypothetical protein